MSETLQVALLAASTGLAGVWLGQFLAGRSNRKDRLRALYAEVMAAALRLTPKSLGYKMSEDTEIPQPAEIDGFIARLMVESEKDEDEVRKAFIGVFNFSMLYGIDKQDPRAPGVELRKTADHVKKNLEDLQRAMRARLK